MKKDIIDMVEEFNATVLNVKAKEKIDNLSYNEGSFLISAIEEEYVELKSAMKKGHVVDQVDALLDMIYFCVGGMVRMGMTSTQIRECVEAVHEANMQKAAGKKEGREGGADAIKPEGWIAPEAKIAEIIKHEKLD